MRLTPRRVAPTLVAAALALPAVPAAADPSTKCFTVPGVWLQGDRVTETVAYCIPWPL